MSEAPCCMGRDWIHVRYENSDGQPRGGADFAPRSWGAYGTNNNLVQENHCVSVGVFFASRGTSSRLIYDHFASASWLLHSFFSLYSLRWCGSSNGGGTLIVLDLEMLRTASLPTNTSVDSQRKPVSSTLPPKPAHFLIDHPAALPRGMLCALAPFDSFSPQLGAPTRLVQVRKARVGHVPILQIIAS